MAFNIFTRKLLTGESIEIFGDGTQSRANTYVSDVVEGLISALSKSEHTEIYNLCGNEQATILEILEMLAKITGKVPNLIFKKERLGDQQETKSVAHKAISKLGFTPRTMLHEGLINQVNWQLENAHLPHA